jgi:hypothetical protein
MIHEKKPETKKSYDTAPLKQNISTHKKDSAEVTSQNLIYYLLRLSLQKGE